MEEWTRVLIPTRKSMADYEAPPAPNVDMEHRQIQILATVTAPKASNGIDPHKFSSWRKLIHVTAQIRRLAVKIGLIKYNRLSITQTFRGNRKRFKLLGV